MKIKILILYLIVTISAFAQKEDRIWCFGDSAGIDFNNLSNPQPYNSILRARGSCVSISDSLGNLVCYSGSSRQGSLPGDTRTVVIYNKQNQALQNGDSIIGTGWYYELILLPFPSHNNLFYLFSIGVTFDYGLYYSVIDMNQNGGNGAVIQKNIQLSNFRCSDGLSAVKHANGRDWWISFRRGYQPTNEFDVYLLSPSGITGPFVYLLGSTSNSAILRQVFSKNGDKLMVINYAGLIELFNFDRCTGVPSNPRTIESESTSNFPYYISGAFSSSGDLFYLANSDDSCYLMQLNLLDSIPNAHRDTIAYYTFPPSYYSEGQMKLGPDDKIYLANGYYNGMQNFYPYQDSMYNQYNMNISVINSPDSLGPSCDFQKYCFYLGGKRSYLGLPNNPNYNLGPVVGSICDSLQTNTTELEITESNLFVYYNSSLKTAFINAQNLFGKKYDILIYDLNGQLVLQRKAEIKSGYFTYNLDCNDFTNGIYLVVLQAENERITRKFIKY